MDDARASNSSASRQPRRWMLLVLILLTLAVRGRAIALRNDSFVGDPDGYGAIASRLNSDWQYSRRYQGVTGPTAYRPPLYPLVLTAWWQLPGALASVTLLHALLGAGTVWGMWRLGQLSGLPLWASTVAAVLVIVDPILINQSAQLMSETLAAFLAVWALVALARLAGGAPPVFAAVAGAWLGLCVLCRPEFLAWLACSIVALPLVIEGAWRRTLLSTTIVLVTTVVFVAPWALRNWKQFGAPIVTTTHGGYTLFLANNPDFYEYLRSGAWGSVWDAEAFHNRWDSEARKTIRRSGPVLVRDELAADRRAYELGWQTIRDEPAMFAYSCLARVGRLWAVLPHQIGLGESPSRRGLRYSVAIWYTAEFLLAAVGAWSLGRKLLASPWLWSVLLVGSFTLVHAFYWTNMRMRAPLVAVVALLVAVGMARLVAKRPAVTSLEATA